MTLDDLTVNFAHLDRQALMSEWRWLIDSSQSRIARWLRPSSKQPVLLTAGGNAFLQDSHDGSIHFLDTVDGKLEKASSSSEEFRSQLQEQAFVRRYFSVEMIEALRDDGALLPPEKIYSFKVLPVLGGPLETANVEPTDIEVHFSVSGQIHRQVKDIPAGTPITNVRIK